MSTNAYMTATGSKQGAISGSCQIQGHTNQMIVYRYENKLEIPTNTQTGQPTGSVHIAPIQITKEVDEASPLLAQALTTGEVLTDVKVMFMNISKDGKPQNYYTIELKNAIVTAINYDNPMTLLSENGPLGFMETICMTCETISGTDELKSKEFTYSWTGSK